MKEHIVDASAGHDGCFLTATDHILTVQWPKAKTATIERAPFILYGAAPVAQMDDALSGTNEFHKLPLIWN